MAAKRSRKSDWTTIMTVVSVLAAIVSAVVALLSASQSERAMQIASQSNDIVLTQNALLEEAELPRVSIRRLFTYLAYRDTFLRPCLRRNGEAHWPIEMVTGFDVSNLGGRSVALTAVGDRNYQNVDTFSSLVNADVYHDLFGSREEFDTWYRIRPAPGTIVDTARAFSFAPLPINLQAGETHRMVIRTSLHAVVAANVVPQEFQQSMAMLDAPWVSGVHFYFADGTTETGEITMTRPYLFDPPNLKVEAFEPCGES